MTQGSLFDCLSPSKGGTIGLAGLMPTIRAEMNRAASAYAPGRKMLADAISAVARREGVALSATGAKSVSEDMLDKWLQPGAAGHKPSLEAVFCFCIAVGNWTPLAPLFRVAGLTVIPQSDLPYLEYGKTCDAIRKARELKKKQEAKL